MKILITGSEGQLGQTLLPLFADNTVEAHDKATLDLMDTNAVAEKFAAFQPDFVINAAAYTAVDKAESDISTTAQINHLAPATLAKECGKAGAKLIHISTDFVFDGVRGTPYTTDAACHPISVYGKTKLDGEIAIQHQLPDNSFIIRTAWLYSAAGNNFVKTMLRLMREKSELRVVADQVGTPTCASTLASFIQKITQTPPDAGVYHCTDAGVASWYDFAVAIQEEALAIGLLQRGIDIIPIPTSAYPTPAKRPAYSVLDKSKAYASGLLQPTHWRTPLRTTLNILAQQEKSLG